MPDYAVSTTFKAHDRISRIFGRMGNASDKFAGRASKNFDKVSRSASRTGDIIKGVLAANVIQQGFSLVKRGAATATREFIEFDQAVTSASAKFKGLNLATVEGQAAMQQLRLTARRVGADTQFSAGQAAQGLDFLAMAGFNANQAMASLPGVVNLATVANVDLARATDIASDSLGAFGLMTDNTAQLQTNFTRINDVMALTMSRTNTSMEALFEGIKKGAPDFVKAGQSMESFSALMGVMANSGKKGEEAGTALRNVMLRLADPTAGAQKVLDRLNITSADQNGNFLDIVDVLGQFEKGLKGMGDQQRTAALATVFGARAVGAVNILLQEGSSNIRAFRGELEAAAGSSQKMANVMRQSLQNRLLALQSAAIELGFKFITAFEKQAGGAIDKLTQFVRDFDPSPIISAIRTTAKAAMWLYSVLKPFAPLIPYIVGGFVAYSIALKGLMLVSTIARFIQLVTAAHALAGAMGVVNIVMMANPVGLIIAGITALIAVVIYLEKRFNIFTEAYSYWSGVLSSVNPFALMTGSISGVIKLFTYLEKRFNIFTEAYSYWSDKVGQLKSLLGFGDTVVEAPKRAAPNREAVEARQQQFGFEGTLNIAGAPEGSTFESKGAPPINVNLLGPQ